MKKFFVSVTGAIALVLGVGLNLQNAINDYGISSNSLSTFVLAQTNTSGTNSSDGSSSGGGTLYHKPYTSDCILAITGNANVSGTIFGCEITTVKGGGGVTITVHGARVDCKSGGNYKCTYRDCFTVFSALMK